MRTLWFMVTLLFLSLSLILYCGCAFTIEGDFGSSGDIGAEQSQSGEASWLPEPAVWRVEPPQLTPEQQQRNDEVDMYLAEQYRDYTIVEATQGYSGDITYWVETATMPGANLEPPPLRWKEEALKLSPGAEIGRAEIDLYEELRGPEGTTPFHRPDFGPYIMGLTGAVSLQDYLENYQVPGQPLGKNRLYAGLRWDAPNKGAFGTINQFEGDVELGTFSLIEITVACDGLNFATTLEQVGAVISRDKANFSDSQPRIHVEFLTRGPKATGYRTGGWDEKQTGFVAYPGRRYGPGAALAASKSGEVVPASVPGLAQQREHFIEIEQDTAGNWWVAHNGYYLGYYPANLFDTLNFGACASAWYGEVFDPTPTNWTWTDMGSSEHASAGYGYAAYVKSPRYRGLLYTDIWPPIDGLSIDPDPTKCFTCMKPFDDNCYTRSVLKEATDYIYISGPGGDAVGCD